jgi:hypothetical protein
MAEGVESDRRCMVRRSGGVMTRWFCLAGSLLVLLPVERERIALSRWRGTVPFGEGERRGRIVHVIVVKEKSFRCSRDEMVDCRSRMGRRNFVHEGVVVSRVSSRWFIGCRSLGAAMRS